MNRTAVMARITANPLVIIMALLAACLFCTAVFAPTAQGLSLGQVVETVTTPLAGDSSTPGGTGGNSATTGMASSGSAGQNSSNAATTSKKTRAPALQSAASVPGQLAPVQTIDRSGVNAVLGMRTGYASVLQNSLLYLGTDRSDYQQAPLVEATPEGWVVLGVAWYWWAGLLTAGVAVTRWVLQLFRRSWQHIDLDILKAHQTLSKN